MFEAECPACNSRRVRYSRRRPEDLFRYMRLQVAFRCRQCSKRFYEFCWFLPPKGYRNAKHRPHHSRRRHKHDQAAKKPA